MVYCKRLKKGEDFCVYNYGGIIDDMTGEIGFYSDDRGFEVIKEPEIYKVGSMWIRKLYTKYANSFRSKIFNERIAYEC